MTDNLYMNSEISKRIGRAISTLAKLSKRVWDNAKLTLNTKMTVYRACVLGALVDFVREARKEAQHFPHTQLETDSAPQMVELLNR